jgi:hypothetical protein
MIDLEGMALLLPDGMCDTPPCKAYIRDGKRLMNLKCMPSVDADKYDNYIKFLKRR